jgi:hypothetical protein
MCGCQPASRPAATAGALNRTFAAGGRQRVFAAATRRNTLSLTEPACGCAVPIEIAPGVEDFLEDESRLNDVVPQGRDTVVCVYDLSETSAALIVDVLRTHPMIILGGMLHENPFYTPVAQFLAELRERRAQTAVA